MFLHAKNLPMANLQGRGKYFSTLVGTCQVSDSDGKLRSSGRMSEVKNAHYPYDINGWVRAEW